MAIRSQSDIEAIEATPLVERALPENTYAALLASTKRTPNAKALSFFLTADSFDRPHVWTYAELLADVTRAANAFHALGVTPEHPVAFVLPNLPETHFTIWGGETAGVVLAINPMLEPKQIANLMRVARVRVLVTLAPALNEKLWSSISAELATLPDLSVVTFVDMAPYLDAADAETARRSVEQARSGAPGVDIVDLRSAMLDQPSDHLVAPRTIKAGDASSYFCTGGTTGQPKIAVRTHGCEIFDAWAVARVIESDGSPRTFFCGLPLFHVNAQLVTGLLPWMCGDHVVIGTPEGYRGKGSDSPLVGNHLVLSHLDVLRRADDLRRTARNAGWRRRHLEPAIRHLRRGANAGESDRRVRSQNWREDSGGLWPDRGRVRLLPQPS